MATFKINGKSIQGSNIVIINGKVIVDGKGVQSDDKIINITIEGNVEKMDVDVCNTISVKGEVNDVQTKSGDIEVHGNVKGSVSSMSGDVEIGGDVGGNASSTSGDIICKNVSGNVSTMSGDITHK